MTSCRPGMIGNGDDRVVSSKSPTKVRVSSPTGIHDSVIPRSGPSGFTKVDPGGMLVGGADREEKFYLHPKNFSKHPIKEIECKNRLCVIWGV